MIQKRDRGIFDLGTPLSSIWDVVKLNLTTSQNDDIITIIKKRSVRGMERTNLWKIYTEEQLVELEKLNETYKSYLDKGKTERECVKEAIKMAESVGYTDLKSVIANGETLCAGDKVYAVCMDKTIALFQIGKEPIEKGMNILGAHVDSPRIDLKQNPL